MAHRRPGLSAGFRKTEKEKDRCGVPEAMLKQARQSGQLNLSGRSLGEVPTTVWRINIDVPKEAQNISFGNNDERWWDQTDLTKLILASNQLTTISDEIIKLPALTVLDLHDNNISWLPEKMSQLTNIQRLNLSHNKLQELPQCIGELKNVTILLLSHNEISFLGDHVGNLYHLDELDVSHNQIRSVPQTLGFLTRMTKLNLSENQIERLPNEIGEMDCLRFLDCNHNSLECIPDEIARMSKLEQLYLRHNRLKFLPVLTHCKSLKEVHAGNNALRELSASHIQNLPAISVLDIRDNKISVLPDEIAKLQALERLDLSNNEISSLPYVLGTLPNLKSIVLDGNPLKSVRRDIVMRGTMELKKYLCSRITEENVELPQKNTGNVHTATGSSGIVGGSGLVDSHTVKANKSLIYSEKKATEVPADIWDATEGAELLKIDLQKNLLTSWPDKLNSFKETLQEILLSFNKLSSIPSDVGNLTRLVHLDIRCNQITSLPSEMNSCQNLREIALSMNRLKSIPHVLLGLPKLEVIIASDNQINSLDVDGLKDTPRLATLDLQNNDMTQIPAELGNCTQLRSLLLSGNPCRNPRPAILTKDTATVLEYLRNRIVK